MLWHSVCVGVSGIMAFLRTRISPWWDQVTSLILAGWQLIPVRRMAALILDPFWEFLNETHLKCAQNICLFLWVLWQLIIWPDLKRLYDSNHCFTRLTERAYHLNEISRGIFWTNGTALYLSMEMDRFDPKFRNTHGREPGQQQRWRQTYCVLAEPHPQGLLHFSNHGRWEKSLGNAELTPLLIGSFIRAGWLV